MQVLVPDAQIHVLVAHGGIWLFHGTGLCLTTPNLHKRLIAIALEGQLSLLLLVELEHAPGVQILLSLQILQVGLIL